MTFKSSLTMLSLLLASGAAQAGDTYSVPGYHYGSGHGYVFGSPRPDARPRRYDRDTGPGYELPPARPERASSLCTGKFRGSYTDGTPATLQLRATRGDDVNVTLSFGKKTYRTVGSCEAYGDSARLSFSVGNPPISHRAIIRAEGRGISIDGRQENGGYGFEFSR